MRASDLDALVTGLDARALPDEMEEISEPLFGAILGDIYFHDRNRFWQFTPRLGWPFMETLADWLSNPGLTEDDQKTMLRSVLYIQFVDRDDMLALYAAALRGPIVRWLMDELALDFSMEGAELTERVSAGLAETWFCGITDSMDIAQFHHVNNLTVGEQRPPWRVLTEFGDLDKIRNYMDKWHLKRIVLLEDFIGSGTQSTEPVLHAVNTFCPGVPVLFVPLVASQVAVTRVRDEVGQQSGFRFDPLFTLPISTQLQELAVTGEPSLFTALRETVGRTWPAVSQSDNPAKKALRHAFGFGKVGALLVLYTNCPNNTLPVFWHKAPAWQPLFQRVSRV